MLGRGREGTGAVSGSGGPESDAVLSPSREGVPRGLICWSRWAKTAAEVQGLSPRLLSIPHLTHCLCAATAVTAETNHSRSWPQQF